MYFVNILALLVGLILFTNADPAARLAGGQIVDSLSQFPFYVSIIKVKSGRQCGGSILNAQWVITSAFCIEDSTRLELQFAKNKQNDNAAGYYSVSVNKDQIYVYPTTFDDLALIKIPLQLVFSDIVKPVNISRLSVEKLRNLFAVLPGFNDPLYDDIPMPQTPMPAPLVADIPPPPSPAARIVYNYLTYGMFNILDNAVCQQRLGSSKFNEYNQVCTEGWGTNPNTPCDSDFGSGLIIGWPAKSELVGIFSTYSSSCIKDKPAVYSYVPKYLTWIESMIQG